MKPSSILTTIASALALAFVVYSCRSNLAEAQKLDLSKVPIQVVDTMLLINSENGLLKMRVESERMEVYEYDTLSYNYFPRGINVYGYSEEGLLETIIIADEARHDKFVSSGKDLWSAYGNVVVRNILKREKMETDTLYWDEKEKEIWTDCYIKMSSPDGFMQGYGMRSDEMARNSILLNPFDNEFFVDSDSTKVVIDTLNFIGPLLKK